MQIRRKKHYLKKTAIFFLHFHTLEYVQCTGQEWVFFIYFLVESFRFSTDLIFGLFICFFKVHFEGKNRKLYL